MKEGKARDIFNASIILFELVSGELPLNHNKNETREEFYENLSSRSLDDKEWLQYYHHMIDIENAIPDCLKSLLKSMTTFHCERPSIPCLLSHKWL